MKNFILASRPRTLILSILPPMVSYHYAHSVLGSTSWDLALFAIFSALMIQLATNFFNDLIDCQKGADLNRIGPVRVLSAGLVTSATLRRWAFTALALALLAGIPLILKGGPVILILGLVSLYLAYGYTGGVFALAYRGLGELFVFLFFGLFAVLGSVYIYARTINLNAVLLASAFGFLSMTFICINNLRDRDEDRRVQKRTLATRMSYGKYQLLVLATILLPHVIMMIACLGFAWANFALVLALPLIKTVLVSRGAQLNKGLKEAGLHVVVFSAFVSLDIFYERLL